MWMLLRMVPKEESLSGDVAGAKLNSLESWTYGMLPTCYEDEALGTYELENGEREIL